MNLTEFQQIVSSAGKPLVVDVWAPWCAPYRVTKPILEKLAQEYQDKVTFLPVNADEAHENRKSHPSLPTSSYTPNIRDKRSDPSKENDRNPGI